MVAAGNAWTCIRPLSGTRLRKRNAAAPSTSWSLYSSSYQMANVCPASLACGPSAAYTSAYSGLIALCVGRVARTEATSCGSTCFKMTSYATLCRHFSVLIEGYTLKPLESQVVNAATCRVIYHQIKTLTISCFYVTVYRTVPY